MAGLIWRFARHLKRLRPHVLLSFMWYPNAIAIIAGRLADSRLKVAVSERTSTSVYSRKADSIFRSAIIRFLYPRAYIVISPSEAIAQDLISRGNRSDKLAVIQNPVDLTMVRELACAALDHPWYRADEDVIIAIGRLGSEKGFHYLVRAIALLRKEEVACKLLILGEGQERKTLEELIARLGLQECVELAGFQQNPYKYLIRSRIFVLSSLYEGFPNVLLEALALGIPSVATRCLTGPEEIISDGVNGILVPPADERMLADAVRRLLQDEDLRGRLGEEGKKRAEDFGVEKIVRRFEGLIESLSAEPVKK
jgi:glycosyltransferase involved in cell wall biosynthesis